jgi:hypothetical protein
VGLKRGSLSLVSTTEELLGRKSNGSALESREYGRGDPSRLPRGTLYPQKLALTSSTGGVHSVGIVRLWTQATKFLSRGKIKIHGISCVELCMSIALTTCGKETFKLSCVVTSGE